ncbi:hypothetical protein EGJ51_17880 [Pseudomonas fulva]|uniref:Uncharacterized protein n=1 Tax=Pseudomonas parafulva TaxID=157782 RepID=A0AAJ0LIQ9_9PSED|nr:MULTISPECIES: hypothetical protein [Pseudomonas]KTT16911.1 hypothetical protein NS96R_14275 [Pseudomonas parafulva]MBA1218197.1 hypothetical protein [Pseudomonas fulva]RRW59509.1 hypothetical protein EGJ51_17880 [Pseudomonas fulva]
MILPDLFDGDLAMTRESIETPIGEMRFLITRKSWEVLSGDEDMPSYMPHTNFVVIAHHPVTGVMTMAGAKLEDGDDLRTACADAAQDLTLSVQAIKAYLKGLDGTSP